MPTTITVSAFNRPEYLSQTLSALSQCEGISSSVVTVVLDPSDKTDEQVALARRHGFNWLVLAERSGCGKAILSSLVFGFVEQQSPFHVHMEDDTVPCKDAILYFQWAARAHEADESVFTVSGYSKTVGGGCRAYGRRAWYTPWGWGTWQSRWHEILAGFSVAPTPGWDHHMNNVLRRDRVEVFPIVSRLQNIGACNGTHVPNPEWHAEHQRTPATSDSMPCAPVSHFVEMK